MLVSNNLISSSYWTQCLALHCPTSRGYGQAVLIACIIIGFYVGAHFGRKNIPPTALLWATNMPEQCKVECFYVLVRCVIASCVVEFINFHRYEFSLALTSMRYANSFLTIIDNGHTLFITMEERWHYSLTIRDKPKQEWKRM